MSQFNQIAQAQFDEQLGQLRKAAIVLAKARPRAGWISALRHALGMTGAALGRRMGVSRTAIYKLEANEADESITLGSLRRAAEALDADFVYAVVPRASLRQMIDARAHEIAEKQLSQVATTMRLEDQSLTANQLKSQIDILAAQLAKKPSALWL